MKNLTKIEMVKDYIDTYKQQEKRKWQDDSIVKVLAAKCDDPSSIPGAKEKPDAQIL